jgi:hypothetical protein
MILLMSLLATFVALSILGNVVGYWFGSKKWLLFVQQAR